MKTSGHAGKSEAPNVTPRPMLYIMQRVGELRGDDALLQGGSEAWEWGEFRC